MNTIRSVTIALAASLASIGYAQTTILSQDFSAISAATYTANGSLGTGTGSLSFTATTNEKLEVTAGGTLRFTDGAINGATPNSFHAFTGATTGATGNNAIVGTFDFQPLAVSVGTRGSFVFMINGASQANSGPNTSVYLLFANSGLVSYNNGGALTSSGFSTTNGVNYRVSVIADYSNTTGFDTFTYTITNLDTSSIAYTSTSISTRAAATVVPNVIAFYGGALSTSSSADPFFQIDNINFQNMNVAAVPEPATAATLLGLFGLGGAAFSRRRRA